MLCRGSRQPGMDMLAGIRHHEHRVFRCGSAARTPGTRTMRDDMQAEPTRSSVLPARFCMASVHRHARSPTRLGSGCHTAFRGQHPIRFNLCLTLCGVPPHRACTMDQHRLKQARAHRAGLGPSDGRGQGQLGGVRLRVGGPAQGLLLSSCRVLGGFGGGRLIQGSGRGLGQLQLLGGLPGPLEGDLQELDVLSPRGGRLWRAGSRGPGRGYLWVDHEQALQGGPESNWVQAAGCPRAWTQNTQCACLGRAL